MEYNTKYREQLTEMLFLQENSTVELCFDVKVKRNRPCEPYITGLFEPIEQEVPNNPFLTLGEALDEVVSVEIDGEWTTNVKVVPVHDIFLVCENFYGKERIFTGCIAEVLFHKKESKSINSIVYIPLVYRAISAEVISLRPGSTTNIKDAKYWEVDVSYLTRTTENCHTTGIYPEAL